MRNFNKLLYILISVTILSCSIIDPKPKNANHLVFIGSYDDNLYALNAKTGEVKWKYKTKDKFTNSCTIYDNLVYFYQDAYITALEVNTGKKVWEYYVEAYNPIASPPFIIMYFIQMGITQLLVWILKLVN